MSDIFGTPPTEPIRGLQSDQERRQGFVRRDGTGGESTTEQGDHQQERRAGEPPADTRDPAVSIAASTAHVEVGDVIRARVSRTDSAGRPVINAPNATFALKPDAGLKPEDDVALQVVEAGKRLSAQLVEKNARRIQEPPTLQLTVIEIGSTGPSERPSTPQQASPASPSPQPRPDPAAIAAVASRAAQDQTSPAARAREQAASSPAAISAPENRPENRPESRTESRTENLADSASEIRGTSPLQTSTGPATTERAVLQDIPVQPQATQDTRIPRETQAVTETARRTQPPKEKPEQASRTAVRAPSEPANAPSPAVSSAPPAPSEAVPRQMDVAPATPDKDRGKQPPLQRADETLQRPPAPTAPAQRWEASDAATGAAEASQEPPPQLPRAYQGTQAALYPTVINVAPSLEQAAPTNLSPVGLLLPPPRTSTAPIAVRSALLPLADSQIERLAAKAPQSLAAPFIPAAPPPAGPKGFKAPLNALAALSDKAAGTATAQTITSGATQTSTSVFKAFTPSGEAITLTLAPASDGTPGVLTNTAMPLGAGETPASQSPVLVTGLARLTPDEAESFLLKTPAARAEATGGFARLETSAGAVLIAANAAPGLLGQSLLINAADTVHASLQGATGAFPAAGKAAASPEGQNPSTQFTQAVTAQTPSAQGTQRIDHTNPAPAASVAPAISRAALAAPSSAAAAAPDTQTSARANGAGLDTIPYRATLLTAGHKPQTVEVRFAQPDAPGVSGGELVQSIQTLHSFVSPKGPRADIRVGLEGRDLLLTLPVQNTPQVGGSAHFVSTPDISASAAAAQHAGTAEALAAGLASLPALEAGGLRDSWPVLEAAQGILAPEAQASLAARSAAGGGRMVQAVLFLLTALGRGSPAEWLGGPTSQDLQNRQPRLLERLKDDIGKLLRRTSGEAPGTGSEWRALQIPFELRDNDLSFLHMLWRREESERRDHGRSDGEAGHDGDATDRFLIGIHFELLGPIQLDGRISGHRFDLTLSCESSLSNGLKTDIRTLFGQALDANGFKGQFVVRDHVSGLGDTLAEILDSGSPDA